MGRLVPKPHRRPLLGAQGMKSLSRYERKAKTLMATRGRTLSVDEENELQWLFGAQECIKAGLLTVQQVKGLKRYRTLSPTARFQELDQEHMKLRTHLGLLNGQIPDNGGHGKIQSLLNETLALEARGEKPTRLLQQADGLRSQGPGAATASATSPDDIFSNPGAHPEPTSIQHPKKPKPFWRVWGLMNAAKSRILSAKQRLFQFPWKANTSQRDSFHGKIDRVRHLANFFARRDMLFFHMSPDPLRFYRPPPKVHQDLFDAASRVVRVENIIGYRFENKMLCIEALKGFKSDMPLYWQGAVTPIADNQRLALIGDRTLALAMTELWWQAKLPISAHTTIRELETRASLGLRATSLGIDDTLVIHRKAASVSSDVISETLEAIIGAVYVDSNNNLSVVQRVLKKLHFEKDLHQLAGAMKSQREPAAGPTASQTDPATEPVTTAAMDPATESANDLATESTTASISTSTLDTSTSLARNSAMDPIGTLTFDPVPEGPSDSVTSVGSVAPEEDLSATAISVDEVRTDAPSSCTSKTSGLFKLEQTGSSKLEQTELFKNRWFCEKTLASNCGRTNVIRFGKLLKKIKLEIKSRGVTAAEYGVYKRHRLKENKRFARFNDRQQRHIVELEELLGSESISLERRQLVEQRIRVVRQRLWYMESSADMDAFAGDEDVRISKNIVARDIFESIEDAYLSAEVAIGQIMFSEILALSKQAALRSIAVDDFACDLLDEWQNLGTSLNMRSLQLRSARSRQANPVPVKRYERLENRRAEIESQFPSMNTPEGRRAWRKILKLPFKKDPPAPILLVEDHNKEISRDDQREKDEGIEKNIKQELDLENPQEQKTVTEAHREDLEIHGSKEELS